MKVTDGFDGQDQNLKMHAAANGDDDGFEGGAFDDDDEEEEVIVTMTSDDDDDLDRAEDEADDLIAEVAIIAAVLPSPVAGYTPATMPSKLPVPSVSAPACERGVSRTSP